MLHLSPGRHLRPLLGILFMTVLFVLVTAGLSDLFSGDAGTGPPWVRLYRYMSPGMLVTGRLSPGYAMEYTPTQAERESRKVVGYAAVDTGEVLMCMTLYNGRTVLFNPVDYAYWLVVDRKADIEIRRYHARYLSMMKTGKGLPRQTPRDD